MIYVGADFVKEHKDALLIDCRFNLHMPEEGRRLYDEGHIKGAIHIDLDKDLMGELGEHGGRHPLPDMEEFRKRAENFGISDDKVVIIYDDGLFPASSRLCFMLKYLGKESYIVNGGYEALKEAGFETDTEVPVPEKGKLSGKINSEILVDIDYVLENKDKENIVLVDSRSEERHLGIEEPADKIAGRIPGTVNIFWKNCFDGIKLKPVEELEKIFADIKQYDEAIFHCGSGVTGAVNTLIFEELGGKAKLYGGSYSDYISYKGLELIIKDDEKITL